VPCDRSGAVAALEPDPRVLPRPQVCVCACVCRAGHLRCVVPWPPPWLTPALSGAGHVPSLTHHCGVGARRGAVFPRLQSLCRGRLCGVTGCKCCAGRARLLGQCRWCVCVRGCCGSDVPVGIGAVLATLFVVGIVVLFKTCRKTVSTERVVVVNSYSTCVLVGACMEHAPRHRPCMCPRAVPPPNVTLNASSTHSRATDACCTAFVGVLMLVAVAATLQVP
jgi:hypothetical protein